MVERARDNDKIEFVVNSVVEDVLGADEVTGIKLKNTKTDDVRDLNLDGVFVAIGHTPNTKLFQEQINMDDKGYIKTSENKQHISATNIPGVFACGDVQDSRYRQAITAAGSGCQAALDAEHFLNA